jgi:hypothetical protein
VGFNRFRARSGNLKATRFIFKATRHRGSTRVPSWKAGSARTKLENFPARTETRRRTLSYPHPWRCRTSGNFNGIHGVEPVGWRFIRRGSIAIWKIAG